MKIVKRTDLIELNEELKISVSDAISHLSKLPITFIEKQYATNKNKLAIKYYRDMLIALMEDQVSYLRIMESALASHMSHNLSYFNEFAVFQLENLLPKFANEENDLLNEFYEDIWLVLLQISNQLGITDETLKTWIVEAITLEPKNHNLDEHLNIIHQIFKDEEKKISGLTINEFKVIVEKSATDKEIRTFAQKFNIELPKSLQKQQVYEIILNGLNEKYPNKQEFNQARLKDLTVIELKRLAKNEGLTVNYEINKKSTIERLLEKYPFSNYQSFKVQAINLPPRVRVNTPGQVNERVVTKSKEPHMVYSKSNDPSKVVYTNHGEPIHIHVYYDGLENNINNNERGEVIFTKVESWPLWLKILILVLALILGTIILVIFLDITTLFPHEQSVFTRLIFDLLFPNS